MSKYKITPSFHSKKRIDIWLVKPNDKLDYSDYKKLESKIKTIGGYYSRFSRSFVFEQEPNITQLNEAFGDTQTVDEKASNAGVPIRKLALIELNNNFGKVDRRTLKKEYEAGKLLVAKTSFFDGMIDSTQSIPESEWKWSDKDNGFEQEFNYSKNPYTSGEYIRFGDYKVKYKDDIVQPEKKKVNRQSSINFYVNVDSEKQVNQDDKFTLDRIDSDSKEHKQGDRVVLSMYGNKYCGYITDKKVNVYQIRSWTYGSKEALRTEESVYYTVKLDNGVVRTMAQFKIDTDNECDELSADAIYYNDNYVLAEQFWSDIIKNINNINALKRQKAARKKAAYAENDQKHIDRRYKELLNYFALWMGWEQKNNEYSLQITGETEEEQKTRIYKWINEYGILPKKLIRPKSVLINKLTRANNLLLN